jgi:Tfp pilus assembly protein PilO
VETGLDGPQVQAIRRSVGKMLRDPGQLRLTVVGVIGLGAFFGLCRPESERLAEARALAEKLEATAADAEELRGVVKQGESYLPRVPKGEDTAAWQSYVNTQVEAAGVTLRKVEPRKTLSSGPFRVVVLEVTVDGNYTQLVDFFDRLERGERIVRLDRISFEKRAAAIGLRFQLLGLVKIRA